DVLSPWAYVTYADDAVVIFQYKTEEEVRDAARAIHAALEKWCGLVKVKLSWPKTQLMCFPKCRVHGGIGCHINMGDHVIVESPVRWLGVALDRKFRWGAHAANILTQLEGIYHSVKAHVRSSWGLGTDVALVLFEAVARGCLLHAVGCWGHAALRARIAKQLRALQARFYRRARRLSARTPTAFVSHTGTDGIPWDLLCVSQCIKRRLSGTGFPAVPSLHDELQRIAMGAPVDSPVSAVKELRPLTISSGGKSPCRKWVFYTDGAASRNQTAGCAAVLKTQY
ncbi:hypothetical protein FOZ62_014117, partial [Perkinsus olseni]